MPPKKILVIDDEQGIRDLLKFLLQPKGYLVYTANDGIEGLEMYKKDIYDAVLLDVHMPGMNGIEVLKIIKQIRPEQVVIISSSSSDPHYESEEAAKQLGASACFFKPFYIDEIINVLEESLKSRGEKD